MEFRKALMSAATARKIATNKEIRSAKAWHEIVERIIEAAKNGHLSTTNSLADEKLKDLTDEDIELIRRNGYQCEIINNDVLFISWE